jgi:hypothetical protein
VAKGGSPLASPGAAWTIDRTPERQPISADDLPAIVAMLDRKGGGVVEILDRLHAQAAPGKPTSDLPCGWLAATGRCRLAATDKCVKCRNGAAPDPALLAKVKAACTERFLERLTKDAGEGGLSPALLK